MARTAFLIPSRTKTVTCYLQACCEPGCKKAWPINENSMGLIAEDKWGRTKCYRHAQRRDRYG